MYHLSIFAVAVVIVECCKSKLMRFECVERRNEEEKLVCDRISQVCSIVTRWCEIYQSEIPVQFYLIVLSVHLSMSMRHLNDFRKSNMSIFTFDWTFVRSFAHDVIELFKQIFLRAQFKLIEIDQSNIN